MADPKKVYWDTCVWISLINGERGRLPCCQYIIDEARARNLQIWTSAFTLAEVFKVVTDGKGASLSEVNDSVLEQYVEQDFVVIAQVDYDVGVQARRLLRKHPKLRKPSDAVHLATAVLYNLDEFHTYDEANLLALSGMIHRQDGTALTICKPPENPNPPLFQEISQAASR